MGNLSKFNFSKEVRSYSLITLGMLVYAVAAICFIIPHKIVGGGATGLSTVIYYLSNETIPVGLSYFVINLILLVIALKILGPKFGVKTIYAIIVGSVFLGVLQPLIGNEAIVTDRFMSTIIAAILTGVGIGVAIAHGGSTGGTDVVAMLVTKYHNVSPGKVLMYCDFCVIATTLLINPNIEGLMYGYVMMGVVSFTVDYVLTGHTQSAQLFIFSEKFEEVAEAISDRMNRGVTIIDGIGWYTKSSKKIILVVARKTESSDILRLAKEIDSKVFMTMSPVMGVFGEGFEELKQKK